MPRKPPEKSDKDLIRESLRAVLASPETSAKALAAKAQAARQLSLLNGAVEDGKQQVDDAPYPMDDLWEAEVERRSRMASRERRRVGARAV